MSKRKRDDTHKQDGDGEYSPTSLSYRLTTRVCYSSVKEDAEDAEEGNEEEGKERNKEEVEGDSAIDKGRFKQESGGYYALNSICNALPKTHAMSKEHYMTLHGLGSETNFQKCYSLMREVLKPSMFYVKKVKNEKHRVNMLQIIKSKTSGVYIIHTPLCGSRYVSGHYCYTWDADNKVIIDPDLKHPEPLDISTYDSLNKSLSILGIKTIDKAYEIFLYPLK